MAKSQPKIALSVSRDIPFNKLVLSQANVRRVKAGVAIEELAEDIARRTLLQSLTVRPVLDDERRRDRHVRGAGRRPALPGARAAGEAEAPGPHRADPLHRAHRWPAPRRTAWPRTCSAPHCIPSISFALSWPCAKRANREEEIAAAFFVSVNVVSQRLRLAAVSPKLLDVYAEDGMTLDQLMAFTVNPDHARQEQVWEALQRSPIREPYQIRRLLTESAVRASDKRAQFVGIADYEAAGGIVLRDLFEADDGGWLQDPALLDRLVAEKLEREAEAVRGEGWKWVEVAPDFPYGHTYGLRRLSGSEVPLTEEEAKPATRSRPSSTSSRRPTRTPRRSPRRSMRGSARSRRRWRHSTSGRSSTMRPRSRAPASSSASTATAPCASSAATCGRRTRRRWRQADERRRRARRRRRAAGARDLATARR